MYCKQSPRIQDWGNVHSFGGCWLSLFRATLKNQQRLRRNFFIRLWMSVHGIRYTTHTYIYIYINILCLINVYILIFFLGFISNWLYTYSIRVLGAGWYYGGKTNSSACNARGITTAIILSEIFNVLFQIFVVNSYIIYI